MFAAASYMSTSVTSYVLGPPTPSAGCQAPARSAKKRRGNRSSSSGHFNGSPHSVVSAAGRTDTNTPQGRLSQADRPHEGKVGAHDLVDYILQENDLYAILGVGRRASCEDLRRAYITRARTCHPDKLPLYPPCTEAFQKLSLAYETLSKPAARHLYDLGIDTELAWSARSAHSGFGDETLNNVLHATFCEFIDGDFSMIRVLVNALNEGNDNLQLGDDAVHSLETALRRLRGILLAGNRYLCVVRYELMRLYEIQHNLRSLSLFNVTGRLRLTLALARVTLSIPIAIDRVMREGDGSDDEASKQRRPGLLPGRVAGLLGATVAVLEAGEKVALWGQLDSPSWTSANTSNM